MASALFCVQLLIDVLNYQKKKMFWLSETFDVRILDIPRLLWEKYWHSHSHTKDLQLLSMSGLLGFTFILQLRVLSILGGITRLGFSLVSTARPNRTANFSG